MRTFLHALLIIILSSAISTGCALYFTDKSRNLFHHDEPHTANIHREQPLASLKRSAISGNIQAQFTLGTLYYLGNKVTKDNVEARFWFKVASSYGSLDGEVNLASMYKYGEGGDKDLQKSLELYRDAARKGSPAALYSLGRMYLAGDVLEKNPRYGVSLLQDSCRAGYEKSCQLLQIIAG